jgi:hypothetical protein
MPKQETELPLLERGEPAPATTEETLAEPAPPPASTEAPVSGAEPVSRAEFDQLKAERDQLLDRLARMQAEFENARKRAERERIEFRDYATGSVVEQFLPVLDNFALALNSAWWSATTCPTSTWPKRFAAATGCASGSCARPWCAWPPTRNREANEFKSEQSRLLRDPRRLA